MNNASDFLLADARASLLRALLCRPQADSAVMFCYWMLARPVDASEAKEIATTAMERTGAQLDFRTVATLSFAKEAGLLGPEVSAVLRDGLKRLAGRSPIVDEIPMPFCSDAVGILGVALGARALADDRGLAQIIRWLSTFLKHIYSLDGTDNWQRWLFHAANQILGGKIELPWPTVDQAEDVNIALAAKNILPRDTESQAEQYEARALKLILAEGTNEIPYERAAIRLAALDHIVRTAPTGVPGRLSPQDLLRMLERIPAGLRRWTWEKNPRTAKATPRQWHIDHEYHVQNLLWVVLAPIFPDLDDEQYLVKIGQKNPRADLYIPSMKLILEAKFLRPTDRIQRLIDEISSDTSLYGAKGNDSAGLIPVIWDDSGRSQEHDYLRQGLLKLTGIIDVVIISRPSDWNRSHSGTQGKDNTEKKAAKHKI